MKAAGRTGQDNGGTPTYSAVPYLTARQARLTLEDFAVLVGWARFGQTNIKVLERPCFDTLKRALQKHPELLPHLHKVVGKLYWCEGKRTLAKHGGSWQKAMQEYEGYHEEHARRGEVSDKNPIMLKGPLPPSSFVVESEKLEELILGQFRNFFGSPDEGLITPPPAKGVPYKERRRILNRRDKELEWSRGFPRTVLPSPTLALLLIRLCSSDNEWTAFCKEWDGVENNVAMPDMVTKLKIKANRTSKKRRSA